MSLIKIVHDRNKDGLDYMKNHLAGTGVYGSILLDKILTHETEPYFFEGKKKGYSEASAVYEKKLLDQADAFLQEKNQFKRTDEAKEKLIDELMSEIERLDAKTQLTEQENAYLKELLLKQHLIKNS